MIVSVRNILFHMSTDYSAPSAALSTQLVVLAMLVLVLYSILSVQSQHSQEPLPFLRMNYTRYKSRPRRYEKLHLKEVSEDVYLGVASQLVAGQNLGRGLINDNLVIFP